MKQIADSASRPGMRRRQASLTGLSRPVVVVAVTVAEPRAARDRSDGLEPVREEEEAAAAVVEAPVREQDETREADPF